MHHIVIPRDDPRTARFAAIDRDRADRRERRRAWPWRLAAVVIVAVVHIGGVLVLVHRGPAGVAPPVAAMTVHNIALPPSAVPEAPPPPLRAPPLAVPEFAIAPSPPPVAAACDVVGAVASAVSGDAAATAALAPVAADARRAVMVWDGGWSGRTAGDPLRRAIDAALRGQPASCLDEAQAGPRLLLVPVDTSVVAVAVGSGTWRWRGLLADDRLDPPVAGEVAAAEK